MKLRLRNKERPSPSGRGRPRFPVWKDEKLFGFVSLRACLLAAGVGFMAFIILIVWGFFKLSDLSQDVKTQSDNNSLAVTQIKALQKQRHDERLDDQARTDTKIRNIACGSLLLFKPGDAKGTLLRNTFIANGIICPSLGKPFIPTILPSGDYPSRTPRPTPSRPSSAPTRPAIPSSSPRRTGPVKVTVVPRTPAPTQTKTIVRTASPRPKQTLPLIPCATVAVITVNCP